MAEKKQKDSAPPIEINSRTVIGTVYTQLASVTVSDVDITIEFVYVNPKDKKGEVVARVTMPMIVGEELAKVINSTVEQHINSKKKQN